MNYRGYGRSEGEADEMSIYSDSLKLYELVQKKHKKVTLIGRSLGSGVATYLASKKEISKLVLVTPYDSILSIAQSRFFFYPLSWMLTQKYLSVQRIQDIKAQSLILIAQDDETIPFKNSQRLCNAFKNNQAEVKIVKNTTHNTISTDTNYFKLISDFINKE